MSGIGILEFVLLGFLVAGVAVQLFGFLCMFYFRFQRLPKLKPAPYPGVSVIKPCFDDTDNERENFRYFFEQDYPGPFELIFVVGSLSDPIVPTVKDFLARYPGVDGKLLLSTSKIAHWNKVNSLYDAQTGAKHEIVIWSDSDVVVRRDYLRQMASCLQEPGVSVVTTPQYDFRVNNFATAFKVVGNNCDDATFMMGYNVLNHRKNVALGHSLGFWKREFEEFGFAAWELLARFLGDDLGLPYLFNQRGKRVVFRNIYCPVQYSDKKLSQVIEQKRRWVMCQKQVVGNPVIYFTSCLFYPEVPAFFLLLLTAFSARYAYLFLGAFLLRAGISAVFELLFLGSLRMSVRWFWTILLWDLSQVYFVIDGFFRNTIQLKGKHFKIYDRFFLRPADENP